VLSLGVVRVVSAITAAVMPATTAADGPGLIGTGKTSTAIAKYSSFVMIMHRCPCQPPPSHDATLMALVLSSRRMTFRSSNVGSPVTFGREECGNPAISSSGVDAVILVVD
jgi:hypothetical protein